MQRKKSRFWTFIFSFMPGAGEMYMGFMKMGLSLMLGFMILVAIVGYTNLGVLVVFPVTLYIYSFFHANNLSSLDDVEFHNMEDQYMFGFDGIESMRVKLEGRNRKIAAFILIVLGIIMLWQVVFNLLCDIFGWDNRFLSAIYYFVRDELPRAVIGIGVILAGMALIRGKRIGMNEEDCNDESFMGGGRAPYREQPAADRYPDFQERPMDNGQNPYPNRTEFSVQPPDRVSQTMDRNVIYAQGPVADVQNTADNTARNE